MLESNRTQSQERIDFHFRCQVYTSSPAGRVLRYLQSDDIELSSLREDILPALIAFYLPYADRYHGDKSAGELQRSARRARRRLMQRIFDCEEDFLLEEAFALERRSNSNSMVVDISSDTKTEKLDGESIPDLGASMEQEDVEQPNISPLSTNDKDLNNHEDDQLIGNLFS